MKRRNALQLTATILGGTIFGSEIFLSGCTAKKSEKALISDSEIALLDEVGETILPETGESPGAKAAQIGSFMAAIVTDCYSESEQLIFRQGLENINRLTASNYGKEFPELAVDDRLEFLNGLEKEARNLEEGQPHYFLMMKQLTIWGYFSSEPGATKALRYNPVPGEYIGCFPYETGDKAWAE